ncbi:histone-fold-containing protein [Phytophthora cinnamomi]|nr:histone-fold-containing protein [Phytophthora cinnamomi]
MATVEREYAEVKALLLAKQLETNQKAKAKRDAAKLEAAKAVGFVTTDLTTTAMLTATYKRPLQVDIPGSVKKPRTDSYAMPTSTYQPSTASGPPISPRVAQKFYDLDLATRTTTDSDDKMYLPPKVISKIMYRALPGVHDEDAAAATSAGVAFKREDQAKSKTATPAVSPSHSVHDHETSSSQDTISISDDAVTFMQECVTEFLLYFTSEARDRSIMENRRTKKGVGLSIAGEDVVESMENLGFTSYARVLAGYNEKVKASQDAAARMKIERKKLVQQKALEQARAAAAATIAANAAKMAAAGRTVGSPHSYVKIGPAASPLARPVAGTNVATPSRPIASTSAATAAASTASNVVQPPRVVTPTAKPAPAASTTTPKPAAASAAPTSTTK